jgi:hypothetical protein
MKGNAPTVFVGDRTKSDKFLREFQIYQMANRENPAMNHALDRIGIAISYIRRPLVDDWVEHMLNRIDGYIGHGVRPQDERLWTMFKQTFQMSFTDTTKKQNVHQRLLALKMKQDALDDYIAEFKHLCAEAGWGRNDASTLMIFKQGLTKGLHKAVFEKVQPRPTTLTEWENAARTQHALWAEVKASMDGYAPKISAPEAQKWHNVLGKNRGDKGQWVVAKREDCMEVDAVEVNALTAEERTQLQKEGKCFNCRKAGHLSKDCPEKKNAPRNNERRANQGMSARTTKAEEKEKTMVEEIKAMTTEERDELLDNLVLQGF